MSLDSFDLNGLSKLWEVTDETNPLKAAIELEIKNRIPLNKSFTKERIFEISTLKNHAVNITFAPASESFQRYGKNVTLSILNSDEEIDELAGNIKNNSPSFGKLRAKILTGTLTTEQKEKMELEGFSTHDIVEILP
jgi:hypothetical protein